VAPVRPAAGRRCSRVPRSLLRLPGVGMSGLAGGAPLEADLDEATAAAFRKKIGSWLQQNDVAADPEITAQ